MINTNNADIYYRWQALNPCKRRDDAQEGGQGGRELGAYVVHGRALPLPLRRAAVASCGRSWRIASTASTIPSGSRWGRVSRCKGVPLMKVT